MFVYKVANSVSMFACVSMNPYFAFVYEMFDAKRTNKYVVTMRSWFVTFQRDVGSEHLLVLLTSQII